MGRAGVTLPEQWSRACAFIALEGRLLDARDWDAWLALYREDCEYWVPAWADEYEPTRDPTRELSLIYYGDRGGLEDRVFRLRTGRSLASTPLPRTAHLSTVTAVEAGEGGRLVVHSNWATYSYRLEKQHVFFGQQRHEIVVDEGDWRIAKRHILVANDKIPNVMDIYSV